MHTFRSTALRQDCEQMRHEHHDLAEQLEHLSHALQHCECIGEVFADFGGAEEAGRVARWLAEYLPKHFQEEETTVLASMSQLTPALEAFALEMARQHGRLREELDAFIAVLARIEESPVDCMCDFKDKAQKFTRDLTVHMAVEERRVKALQEAAVANEAEAEMEWRECELFNV
jgi:hemerythrin-like domain-containing protein